MSLIDSVTDPLWFFWPVTFAAVAALAVHRLLRRRAWWSAVVAVPVLPLTLAIPIQCSDEDAVLDLRIVALGLGLLGIIGWLAILARLQERAGDTKPDAERIALWSGALLVPGMLVEFVASAITLAVRCSGTSVPMIAHLTVAAVVFTVVAGSALLRDRVDRRSPRSALRTPPHDRCHLADDHIAARLADQSSHPPHKHGPSCGQPTPERRSWVLSTPQSVAIPYSVPSIRAATTVSSGSSGIAGTPVGALSSLNR